MACAHDLHEVLQLIRQENTAARRFVWHKLARRTLAIGKGVAIVAICPHHISRRIEANDNKLRSNIIGIGRILLGIPDTLGDRVRTLPSNLNHPRFIGIRYWITLAVQTARPMRRTDTRLNRGRGRGYLLVTPVLDVAAARERNCQ